jgi:hypothetical protein
MDRGRSGSGAPRAGGAGAGSGEFRTSSSSSSSHPGPGSKRPRNRSSSSRGDGLRGSSSSHSHHHRREDPALLPLPVDVGKFTRGEKADIRHVDDKKYHRETKEREQSARSAAAAAAHAEILLPTAAGLMEAEGEMEKTYKVTQAGIRSAVDVGVAGKAAELDLPTHGPYRASWTRNGRHLLLAGAKGHVSVLDWTSHAVKAEFHVRDAVRDACFLHSSMLFALAQRKAVYIYDHTGAEVHALRTHSDPLALDFLPYHFLLASVGGAGVLRYQDVSTGALVAEHRTKLGPCGVLRQNPHNAVLALGHSNGTVTMWTPNINVPVVKLASHMGPVTALAVDGGGTYMVTAGMDARVKVWDVRRFQPVHDYFTISPARTVDVSQRGLVGIGFGSHVQVWGRDFALEGASVGGGAAGAGGGGARKALSAVAARLPGPEAAASGSSSSSAAASFFPSGPRMQLASSAAGAGEESDDDDDGAAAVEGRGGEGAGRGYLARLGATAAALGVTKAKAPYLRHELPGKTVVTLRFRPYDDVLSVGHSSGMSALIVPGAGEPNYDSLEANPYETKKAKREAEIHALLDRIPATAISLDPNAVGSVDRASQAVKLKEKKEVADAAAAAAGAPGEKKTKRRGIRKALKKQANIITEQRLALEEKLKEETEARKKEDDKRKRLKGRGGGGGGGGDEDEGGAQEDGAGGGRPTSALNRFFAKKER